jgi:hypothetical protein
MAVISTALRHFKEPSKEQLTHIFFSIPPPESDGKDKNGEKISADQHIEKMDINAVLSFGVQGVEDSYVSRRPPSSVYNSTLAGLADVG